MNQLEGVFAEEDRVVLIVSAHDHLQTHYATQLNRLGVRVLVARDAFEALDALRHELVHAILSDFHLPGLDAFGLYLYAQDLHLSLPFVLCGPDLPARRRSEAEALGIFRIIRKSTNGHEIQKSIASALEERERQMLKFFC